jgi:hypothetical protein
VKLDFQFVPDLPRMAWGARLRKDEPEIRVLHGPWVELREECFFEGAWDGPFTFGRFDEAWTMAGSGARLAEGGVVFAGPSHLCERLHSVRVGDELFLSNSLAFLLALTGKRLDPNYRHYFLDFLEFQRVGIRVKEKRLRLLGPGFVELHDCCNVAVRPDLTMSRLEKRIGPPPHNYRDYVSFLEGTLQRVFANAGDAQRRWTYRPVTMLSQGYDTAAISSLASRAGCREAVSFRRSNSAHGYVDDSGSVIAPYLGLSVTEYERTDYEKLPEHRDDEFYIEPWGGDRPLALMEKQLAGSLLLSGRFCDNLWARGGGARRGLPGLNGLPLLQDPAAHSLAGVALGEFRLKTGFIHFPLACSGGLHAPVIHAITDSKAMRPWSVGGSYDRPIARRIAEEAGVPRHLFGQIKKGGPAHAAHAPRTHVGRALKVLAKWAPLKILGRRVIGNRLHWLWRRGSFEVPRGVERITQRYLAAISATTAAKQPPIDNL